MYLYIILLFVTVIMLLISICKKKSDQYDFLSKSMTTIEKGISALLIVFHHLAQSIYLPKYFIIMDYIGFILVAVFFFISGYGLTQSIETKANYLSCFFQRRILPLMIPYWIVITCKMIYLISSSEFDAWKFVVSWFGIDMIGGMWFVTAILILYFLFWICYKPVLQGKMSWNTATVILAVLVVGYCFVCQLLNLHSSYTASISAFLMGVVWKRCVQSRFDQYLTYNYYKKLALLSVAFMLLFSIRLVLSYYGIDNEWLHILFRNIISISFVLVVLAFTKEFELKSRLFGVLGKFSYEIYMIHFVLLQILNPYVKNTNVYVFLIFILTGLCSFMLKKASGKINKWIFDFALKAETTK